MSPRKLLAALLVLVWTVPDRRSNDLDRLGHGRMRTSLPGAPGLIAIVRDDAGGEAGRLPRAGAAQPAYEKVEPYPQVPR